MTTQKKVSRSIGPLAFRSMSEATAADLRDNIILGHIEPGTRITEVELAESMEVSRNVVREAVMLLISEGLMVKERNRYTKVIDFDRQSISDIFILRTALEKAALERCIQEPDFCDELQKYSAKIDACIQKPHMDYEDLMRADIDFHCYIIERSRNHWLMDTWRRIVGPMKMLLYKHMNEIQAMKSSHNNLIQIVRTGDRAQINDAIERHIDDTTKELLRFW